MNSLEKKVWYFSLFSFYGCLLTKKQQEYFTKWLNNDLSLQEVSNLQKVSRSAVHDSIKTTVTLLTNYESKLHLYEKYEKRQSIYEKYRQKYHFIKILEELDKI